VDTQSIEFIAINPMWRAKYIHSSTFKNIHLLVIPPDNFSRLNYLGRVRGMELNTGGAIGLIS